MRPEERDNPLTLELTQWLKEKGLTAFLTFNGLPYWDDKFSRGLKERFMNSARIVRMAYREKNLLNFGWKNVLKEFFADKNGTLKERVTETLGYLKSELKADQFDWVYVSRIDSDDMFHQDFVQEVQSFQPFPGALTFRNGYVYNSNTGQLAEWKPKTNPPFHTIIFHKEDFFQADRYIQYYKGFRSHEDIPTVFNSQNLKDGRYCVLIHKMHVSTIWDHPWKINEIFDINKKQEIKEIINDYFVHILQNRTYEPETMKVIKDNIKEGDICVDVGASIGYVTLNIAKHMGNK